MDLKDELSDLVTHLEELEGHARKLPNQNFADIVAAAKGRIEQLTAHPDVGAVHNKMNGVEEPDELRTDAPPTQPVFNPTFDQK